MAQKLYAALNRFHLVRPLGVLTVATFSLYLLWRASNTLSGAHLVLGIVLLITELMVLVELGTEIYRLWPCSRQRKFEGTPIEASDLTVVIPIVDEADDLVRVTALAAAQYRPAHIVLVVANDRPQIANLADRISASYLWMSTPGANPIDTESRIPSQSRMINWVLPYISTEWIQLVAPGEVPHHDAPRQVSVTERTGVVLLGQRIADANSFEVAANLIWDRRVELQIERPSLQARNILDWAYGPCFVRVKALSTVGGMVEATSHRRSTGRLLAEDGWSIETSKTDLAVGPGSPHLAAMLSTTLRRLAGEIDAKRYELVTQTRARTVRNLTAYAPILTSVRRSIQIVTIATALVTNLPPAAMSIEQLLYIVAPVYLLKGITRSMLKGGLAPWWPAYLQELRTISANLAYVFHSDESGAKHHQHAPKLRTDPGGRHAAKILPAQLILVALLDIAVFHASLGTFLDHSFGAKGLLFLAGSAIAIFNITGLTMVVTSAVARKQMRTLSRLRVKVDLQIDGQPARAIDLTSGGIGLVTSLEKESGDPALLDLEVDDRGPIHIRALTSHISPLEGTNGLNVIGLKFTDVDALEYQIDRLYLYCGATWPFRQLAALEKTG